MVVDVAVFALAAVQRRLRFRTRRWHQPAPFGVVGNGRGMGMLVMHTGLVVQRCAVICALAVQHDVVDRRRRCRAGRVGRVRSCGLASAGREAVGERRADRRLQQPPQHSTDAVPASLGFYYNDENR